MRLVPFRKAGGEATFRVASLPQECVSVGAASRAIVRAPLRARHFTPTHLHETADPDIQKERNHARARCRSVFGCHHRRRVDCRCTCIFKWGRGRGRWSVADCCASDFPHLAHPHPQTQATADFLADKPLAGLLSKLDGLEKGKPCPQCPAGSSTPTYCPAMNTGSAAPWVGGCVDLQTGVIVKQLTSDRYKAINCGSCGGRCDVGCPCVNGTCGSGPACILP